jgi:hypothetical protein
MVLLSIVRTDWFLICSAVGWAVGVAAVPVAGLADDDELEVDAPVVGLEPEVVPLLVLLPEVAGVADALLLPDVPDIVDAPVELEGLLVLDVPLVLVAPLVPLVLGELLVLDVPVAPLVPVVPLLLLLAEDAVPLIFWLRPRM